MKALINSFDISPEVLSVKIWLAHMQPLHTLVEKAINDVRFPTDFLLRGYNYKAHTLWFSLLTVR